MGMLCITTLYLIQTQGALLACMSFPVHQRPQTGPLNPALISAAAAASPQSPTKPQKSENPTGQHLSSAAEQAGQPLRQPPQATAQPVSILFPDEPVVMPVEPTAQPVEPTAQPVVSDLNFDALLAEQDISQVSRLYELLSEKSNKPGSISSAEAVLLRKFDVSVDRVNHCLVSLSSGKTLGPQSLKMLEHLSKMKVTQLSNQAETVNGEFTRQLGLNSASLLDLIASYQNPDGQIKGTAAMLESAARGSMRTVDEAAQIHGMTGFMANAVQATEGLNTAVVRILRGQEMGELDLEQDANFIFAQLLSEKDSAKVSGLVAVLSAKSGPDQISGITASEESLLRQFGIHVDKENKQLVNLITREPLNATQIQAIRQAASDRVAMIKGISFMPGVTLDASTRAAATKIQDAVSNLAKLKQLRASLDQRAIEIAQLQGRVHASQNAIGKDGRDIQVVQTRIEGRTQARDTINTLAGHLSGNTADAFVRAQAQAGKLSGLNQILAGANLSVGVDSQGQVTYRADQKPVSRADFLSKVTQHLDHAQSELSQDQAELTVLQQNRTRHIEEGEVATADLEAATRAQTTDLAHYEQASEQLKLRSLPDLKALKADPDFWNQQSEETRRMIDDLLTQGEQALSLVDETVAHHRKVIQESETVISESKAFVSRARLAAQATEMFLERLQAMLESDSKPTESSEASTQELKELIAEADRLFDQLTLAAQPGQSPALAQDTLMTLEKLVSVLRTSQKEQVTRQRVQTRIQESFLQKNLENLQYHLDKLKALDVHQTEQINQALHKAGQHIMPGLRQLS